MEVTYEEIIVTCMFWIDQRKTWPNTIVAHLLKNDYFVKPIRHSAGFYRERNFTIILSVTLAQVIKKYDTKGGNVSNCK